MLHENEIVGWTQGPHGSSKPVTGLVVGRELMGIQSTDGKSFARVETFVKITGNQAPLLSIPNATFHSGDTGPEVKITSDLSLEYAMQLNYSHNTQLEGGVPINIGYEPLGVPITFR